MQKTKKSKKSINLNLRFEIHYADINASVDNEMYTDEEIKQIHYIVANGSKHIYIDKTYVDFKDTPYSKIFLTENGWKHMCNLVLKTDFGKNCTKKHLDSFCY